MLGKSIQKHSLLLAAFAVVVTTVTALTHHNTKDIIAEQQRIAQAKALLEIIPPERHDNLMLDDTLPVYDSVFLHLRKPGKIHIARLQGAPVAAILPAVAPDGYSGEIHLIVGVNIDGTVAGVRIIAHRETPGLGDKIDTKKSNWIFGFNNHSLKNPKPDKWKVKHDKGIFDQFTGATITPRAVTKSVYQTLLYFKENRDTIFAQPMSETMPKTMTKKDEA